MIKNSKLEAQLENQIFNKYNLEVEIRSIVKIWFISTKASFYILNDIIH